MYVPHNAKKIQLAYKSKHNVTGEKQIILLMISNGENWHYLVVNNLPGLLKGITSNHKEDFYCLNCFHSYRTKNKLESIKKYVKIINIVIISTCYNNPKESSTTEINKHTPLGYSLFMHCSFNKTKNKLDYYRGKDCMKKFCKDLWKK